MSITASDYIAGATVTPQEIEAVDRAIIDSSARLPVLVLYVTALGWLLVAIVLGFAASIKLTSPEFLGNLSWFTYGRILPAYFDAFIYGWAIPAGLGTVLWVLARICRTSLGSPLVPALAALVWQTGVAIGILEILSGNSTGFQFIEFPRFVGMILFFSYSLIAAWAMVMLRERREAQKSVPVWYFCAALLWLPWLLASTYLMLTVGGFSGVVEGLAAAWFAQNLTGLWFVSIGLGVIYYFIPKITGRPIYSRQLALLGFWGFALFWGWTAATRFTGGPIPVWLITVGIGASILLLIPTVAVAANFAMTLRGNFELVSSDPAIRFVGCGAAAWLATTLFGVLTSLRSVDSITHFTQVEVGQAHLIFYAFYSMVIFGSMYYIIPRLLGREWLSASFIQMHFWGLFYGIGMLVFLLVVGGLNEGFAWNNPTDYKSAADVTDALLSFLRVSGIAWVMILASTAVFALHVLILLLGFGNKSGDTISLAHAEEETHS